MALLEALKSILNPSGMAGLPNQLTPNAGMVKNVGGLLDAFMQGNPDYMQNKSNSLRNALMQEQISKLNIGNQFLPQTIQSKMFLDKAKADLANQQTQFMPTKYGIMADRLELDKQRFSPEQLQGLLNWRNAMTATAPQRALTATGKSIIEQANIDEGMLPTGQPTGQPMMGAGQQGTQQAPNNLAQALAAATGGQMPGQIPMGRQQSALNLPDTKENLSGQYGLLRQKQVTDVDTRKRNLYATNVEKTLDTIDPNIIAHYSGVGGKMQLAKDAALAASGKAPPEYQEYQSIIKTKIPMLTSQARQFYGDSIQPSVREHLESLSNVSSWQDPAIGLKRFNDLTNILRTELQTYRDALKSTDVYQGKNQGSSSSQPKYSEADLKHTAEKYGLTVDQVKQKLGVR